MNSFRSKSLDDRGKSLRRVAGCGLIKAGRKNPAVTTGGVLILVLISCLFCGRPGPPAVVIQTELGDITAEIDTLKAPITGSHFLSLVEQGIYQDALFYRVVRMDNQPDDRIRIEVIQGGLLEDEKVDSHPSIEHETTEMTGIRHTHGVISMARNEPGSASTEFFICIGDQPELDFGGARNPDRQGFAAFGKVIEGMEVVKTIQTLPDSGQMLIDPVRILNIRRIR